LREEGTVDDLPYARRVADHLDVDLHSIEVGPEMASEFEEMVYYLDEPQADPAPLNVLFISRLARKNGIKVLLSGAGGDDIFTGYRRHYALMLERYWAWLPLFLREGLRKMSARLPQETSYGRRLSKAFRYGALQKDERLASYFFWSDPSSTTALYGPALEGLRVNSSAPLMEVLHELDRATPVLNRMLALEQKFFLADHNLNYTDKLCMAAGVEGRVPLLDPDIVSIAARLPLEYKQRHGTGKWVFKKAMESTLPQDVIYRPKTGFGVPLRRWLRNELRPLVEELLSPQSLRSRGLFDVAGVAKLVADDRAGRVDGTYTILSLMCIEIWCRRFLSVSVEHKSVAAASV
jgi:asparagine synthase (glutamine-hydrolysing)